MKNFILLFFVLGTSLSFSQVKDVYVPFRNANHWGFSDTNGKIIIKPIYDSVTVFRKVFAKDKFVSYAKVYLDKKVGMINEFGNILFPIKYLDINEGYNKNKFIITDINHKTGLLSLSEVIIPIDYEKIKEIGEDFYLISKKDKIGIAHSNGKIGIPIEYDQISEISNNGTKYKWKVVNEKETKYIETLISKSGIEAIPQVRSLGFNLEEIKAISNISLFNIDSLKLVYDEVIPIMHNYIHDDVFLLKKNNKYGFINLKSKNKIEPQYSNLTILEDIYNEKKQYHNYTLLTKENGKYGVLDEKGTILVPCVYDYISANVGICVIRQKDLKGYYFFKTNKFFIPKFKGDISSENFGESLSNPDFRIIGVYETSKKNWYYIGENGIMFKK